MDKYITLDEYRKLWALPEAVGADAVYVDVDGITLHHGGDSCVKDLQTWQVRDDDSWIVTYPKAGTTWAQEIMSCVMHDGNLEEVNKRHTVFRVPFLELSMPEVLRKGTNLPKNHDLAVDLPSPRVIKSHLPGQYLPPTLWQTKAKVVYVMRNPKDLTVSYFHFTKLLNPVRAKQTFGEFLDEMLTGKAPYGPWWDHYLYFWKKRHDPNVLLLRFEDLKRDLRGNVERISRFQGKNLSDEKLDAITEHCTFANMKKNPMANPDSIWAFSDDETTSFMRKGKVGDWKSHFTVAQNETMDAFIREKFYGTGLTFDY